MQDAKAVKKPPWDSSICSIHHINEENPYSIPMFAARVPAGFPSPADDYIDRTLDLNELLVKHPAATYFVRVSGNSMTGAGIRSGDILIVDRAETAVNNSIVIASLNGELTVKRYVQTVDGVYLLAESPEYEPVRITEEMDFEVWGVVIHVIHSFSKGSGLAG